MKNQDNQRRWYRGNNKSSGRGRGYNKSPKARYGNYNDNSSSHNSDYIHLNSAAPNSGYGHSAAMWNRPMGFHYWKDSETVWSPPYQSSSGMHTNVNEHHYYEAENLSHSATHDKTQPSTSSASSLSKNNFDAVSSSANLDEDIVNSNTEADTRSSEKEAPENLATKQQLINTKKEPSASTYEDSQISGTKSAQSAKLPAVAISGLVSGRSSRHLQYQLDQAVKARRREKGRWLSFNEAGLPEGDLEGLSEEAEREVQALLSDPTVQQHLLEMEPRNMPTGNSVVTSTPAVEANSSRPYHSNKCNTPQTATSKLPSNKFNSSQGTVTKPINTSNLPPAASTKPTNYNKMDSSQTATSKQPSNNMQDCSPSSNVKSSNSKSSLSMSVKRELIDPSESEAQPNSSQKPKKKKSPLSSQQKQKVKKSPACEPKCKKPKPDPVNTSSSKPANKKKKKSKNIKASQRLQTSCADSITDPCNKPEPGELEVNEQNGTIERLLVLSEREEEVRALLKQMEPWLADLLKQQEELKAQVDATTKTVNDLKKEEDELRKNRLRILREKSKVNPVQSNNLESISLAAADSTVTGPATKPILYSTQASTPDIRDGDSMMVEFDTRAKLVSDVLITPSSRFGDRVENAITTQKAREMMMNADQKHYDGHTGAIHNIVVKGDYVYSSSADETIRQFNIKTGACLAVYRGHNNVIKSFLVHSHKDKTIIYSADLAGVFNVFDADTAALINSTDFKKSVLCITEGLGSLYLGLENGNIVGYSLGDQTIEETIETGPSGILSLCICQEGTRRILIIGSYDNLITSRDAKSGLFLKTIAKEKGLPRCLKVDETRPYLYVGGENGLKVLNYQTGQQIKNFQLGLGTMRHMSISTDDNLIVTAQEDGAVCQFDLKALEFINIPYIKASTLLAVCVKRGRIYIGDTTGSVFSFPATFTKYLCQIGGCSLIFGSKQGLVEHAFNSHMHIILSKHTCPWNGCTSTEHHQTKKDLEQHIMLDHL